MFLNNRKEEWKGIFKYSHNIPTISLVEEGKSKTVEYTRTPFSISPCNNALGSLILSPYLLCKHNPPQTMRLQPQNLLHTLPIWAYMHSFLWSMADNLYSSVFPTHQSVKTKRA